MKPNKTDEISMREAISLHLWAAKTWWKIEPKLFITTILHALVKSLTPYVTIWLSAQLINELAGSRNPDTLWKWVILTVSITAGLNLLTAALHHWREAVHGTEWNLENRMEAVKMMNMDFAAVESPKTDEVRWSMLRHMMGNVYGFIKIHQWLTECLIGGIASIAGAVTLTVSLFAQQVPAAAGAMTVLNHPLTAVLMVVLLLGGVVLSPVLEAKASNKMTQIWSYSNQSNRALSFYPVLGTDPERAMDARMYNQQNVAKQGLESNALYREGAPAVDIIRKQYAPYATAGGVVSVILTGIVYVFVCLKAWAGAFGVGSITQYVGAITRLCSGLSDLLGLFGQLPFNAQYLKDIRVFMEIPNDMYRGSLPTEKRDDREYLVEFRDVSFKYPGSDVWALRHVNMKFKVGSRLAVVGMNGSGKTTFIKLLCRLYDPTEGQILLNGIDIRKYKYDDYMNVFSVVFQDFHLLALPLGQNVAVGATYDRERVIDCLERAGFGEKLAAMPKGLDTYLYKELDENGVDVSGGEAQKIAIARALYKDAPFIILDEPTAALDPIAEAEIYSKFNDIAGDKTAIYISHRLSSCKFCDEIAVFHEGAVIQQGTHETLVTDTKGKYYELWNAQAQYYTE